MVEYTFCCIHFSIRGNETDFMTPLLDYTLNLLEWYCLSMYCVEKRRLMENKE